MPFPNFIYRRAINSLYGGWDIILISSLLILIFGETRKGKPVERRGRKTVRGLEIVACRIPIKPRAFI